MAEINVYVCFFSRFWYCRCKRGVVSSYDYIGVLCCMECHCRLVSRNGPIRTHTGRVAANG